MSTKAFIHLAQQQLKSRAICDFSRTHLYEILAATFEFRSYSALCADGIFSQSTDMSFERRASGIQAIDRGTGLGYSRTSMEAAAGLLGDLVSQHRIVFVRFEDLIDELLDGTTYLEEVISDFLLESLMASATRGSAKAYYLLALANAPDEQDEPDSRIDYWYRQSQQGYTLSATQQQFSDGYAALLCQRASFKDYLEKATQLGSAEAALDLADRFGDTSCFDNSMDLRKSDALWIAELAERLGRDAEAKRWFTISAESGNTDAMRYLIETYDKHDRVRCWTWLYLSQLVGDDLTRDRHIGINEDGTQYDDDIGGPMYVGGEDGIHLPPLDEYDDISARLGASELHTKILMQDNPGLDQGL